MELQPNKNIIQKSGTMKTKKEKVRILNEMYQLYQNLDGLGYFGVMTPPVSVKLRHFERSYNYKKNLRLYFL